MTTTTAKRIPVATVPGSSAHTAMTDKMLESMQSELNEAFGAGVAQRLSSAATLSQIEHFTSTRSIVVDKVIAGGRPMPCSLLPFGRQTEISGMPGVGKTSLCAMIAAEVQSKGGTVVVTDTEERIDHPYWRSLGVDTDAILNLTARTIEEVFERQCKFIQLSMEKWPNQRVLMLWDSLGGTSTDAIMDIIEGTSDDKKHTFMEKAKKAMMVKAKTIGSGMEAINPLIAKSKVAYVYTNTLYTKPDVDYGDPMETPGGNNKNFKATLRMRLKRVGQLVEEDADTKQRKIFGHKVEVLALKNSMAPMLIGLEGAVIGGKGFCNEWTVRQVSEALKIIAKSGSWSTWKTPKGEEIKFQGWGGFLEKIVPHPEYQSLCDLVMERL